MIVAVANQKGGIAKSTTCLNLAATLGIGTLLIDLDPQAACAISLGLDADTLQYTVFGALVEHYTASQAIIKTRFGFDLLPSNIDLAEAELALANTPGREFALKRAIEPIIADYHTILIDTPPTLGLLTMNAFAVADQVLIPVSTQLLSLRGLATLLGTIEKVKRYQINPKLTVAGILPTKYDQRTIHGRQVLEYLAQFATEQQLRLYSPIKQTVRFDEAINDHTPFVIMYPDDEASDAYREVAEDVRQA